MDFSSFFDYPDSPSQAETSELTFLANWSANDWSALLEYTQTQMFNDDEVVIQAGDVNRGLYLVSFGTLEVLIPQRGATRLVRFATIEAGSVLGEQSFLDGKPRSAQIRAIEESQLFYLSLDNFDIFAARRPELARALIFDLGRILSLRLRQTTAFISDWAK